MYIHKVILENIKGFNHLDVRFSRETAAGPQYSGWNVLTGGNGSGKTTVLKAITLALVGPEIARALQPSFAGWIADGADEATIAVQIKASESDSFETGRRPVGPFYAELHLERKGGDVVVSPGRAYVQGKRSAINGPWSTGQSVWFAAAYGPFRRLYGTSPDAMRLMSSPGKPPRFATLFKEDATLVESQNWLQELQFKVLEKRHKETEVLADVMELLNADFLRHGLRVDKVNSDGLWLKNSEGVSLVLADMSDGYRSSLALLIDIVRHLTLAYPDQPLIAREGDKVYIPHYGVVLIDEVDAHLHPAWQRDIGFWLKSHFPNIQFIVSSHSAFVCQSADERGIFILDKDGPSGDARIGVDEWRKVVSGTVDQVLLSSAFGMVHTRSPRAVAARKEWSELNIKSKRDVLNASEKKKFEQLSLFVVDEEE
ncbi:AAA family ATPase [Dokdonella sp.]|uniref:AAA family ATPase n=1 Tax=Dokdonella sp. TaxID=2291710 RepID=UPI001B24F7F1|nr:AAA family ATPase [Dokdonella sp.]MBO9663427.1 AAA family ATPase [Dokdonella sp.]